VEFALAVPIFLALFFGALDMGMLFKTRAAYQQAAQEAVRIAAGSGGSDQLALAQFQAMLPAENLNNISAVTIYDATITGAQVSAAPTTFTTYTYNSATRSFVCAGTTHGPPCDPTTTWAPSTQNRTLGASDHIGIRVSYSYRSIIGAFRLSNLTQVASAELEATQYGASGS
jgi:Flp pilus assembly protein TadG